MTTQPGLGLTAPLNQPAGTKGTEVQPQQSDAKRADRRHRGPRRGSDGGDSVDGTTQPGAPKPKPAQPLPAAANGNHVGQPPKPQAPRPPQASASAAPSQIVVPAAVAAAPTDAATAGHQAPGGVSGQTHLNPTAAPFRGLGGPPSLEQLESMMLGKADANALKEAGARMRDTMRKRDAMDALLLEEVERLAIEAERYGAVQEEKRAALAAVDEARATIAALEARLAEESKACAALRGQLADKEAALKARDAALRKAEADAADVRRRCQGAEQDAANAASRNEELAAQLSTAREEYDKLQAAYQDGEAQANEKVAGLSHQLAVMQQAMGMGMGYGHHPHGPAPPMPPPMGALGMGPLHQMGLPPPPPGMAMPPPGGPPLKGAPPGFATPSLAVAGQQQHGQHGQQQGTQDGMGTSPPKPGQGQGQGQGEAHGGDRLLPPEELVARIVRMLPEGPAAAVAWGPAEDAALDAALAPLSWAGHYARHYGTSPRSFALAHTGLVAQRQDGALYRVPRGGPKPGPIGPPPPPGMPHPHPQPQFQGGLAQQQHPQQHQHQQHGHPHPQDPHVLSSADSVVSAPPARGGAGGAQPPPPPHHHAAQQLMGAPAGAWGMMGPHSLPPPPPPPLGGYAPPPPPGGPPMDPGLLHLLQMGMLPANAAHMMPPLPASGK